MKNLTVTLLFMIALFMGLKAQTITTIAGNGYLYFNGDGIMATAAAIGGPSQLFIDKYGSIFIADKANARIRKVDASGMITTVAGGGGEGYAGDGGPATSAKLNSPMGVCLDKDGNIYIADSYNNVIRKVTASTGIITTVAGLGFGYGGCTGDGGLATAAKISSPRDVVADAAGNIYIAEGNDVRKVDVSTGIITTIAGKCGMLGETGDGGPATDALLYYPVGLYISSSGDLYIADYYKIRKIDYATGIINTVAGKATPGYAGDGGPADSALLNHPNGVCLDAAGNMYIADYNNNVIRRVDAATNIITTVAGDQTAGYLGDGGPALSCELHSPVSVRADASGNVLISDLYNGRVRKITGILTGAHELKSGDMQFAVSPNPSAGKFTVSWGSDEKVFSLAVHNLMGEKIYCSPVSGSAYEIDISHYPPGIYFVSLTTLKNSATQKVIVSR